MSVLAYRRFVERWVLFSARNRRGSVSRMEVRSWRVSAGLGRTAIIMSFRRDFHLQSGGLRVIFRLIALARISEINSVAGGIVASRNGERASQAVIRKGAIFNGSGQADQPGG